MDRKPPKTGLPIIDNLLAAAWGCLAALNLTISASTFADVMVGLGAMATLVLTVLRIYEHLMGETVFDTLIRTDQEVEA